MSDPKSWVDLSDLDLGTVEILTQENTLGIPEFAASSGTCDSSCNNSCSVDDGNPLND